jgi:Gene product 88
VGSASVRPLLSLGNDKLGATIHSWSIPAVQTCPGRSCTCERVCYATHGRFLTAQSKAAMRWRWQQSKRPDFAERMLDEVFRRGVLVCRIHVAGDFYSPGYLSKEVIQNKLDVCYCGLGIRR